jgi:molybdopterin synthase catalytic subunit
MTVRHLLFARYAELLGRETVELVWPAPGTVRDLLAQLKRELPASAQLPERPLVAVNQVHARLDALVRDGDEVALLPPMAGG